MVKITILVENTIGVTSGVLGEWGLGMYLDFGDEVILFDTGEQGSILDNAKRLGINLHKVNQLILSHGHYDHTGGLQTFLRYKGNIPIHAHPDLFINHYGKGFNGNGERFIGVPYPQEQLESLGGVFNWHKEPVQLKQGLWFSGEIPRETDFEHIDANLHQFVEGEIIQDLLPDDISLFYSTPQGLVIILGCAHSGLVNIVEYARKVTGEKRIRAIIGGTHLGPASKEQQDKTIEYLKTLDLECLAPNHCTGLPMLARLAAEFPIEFRWATTGSNFEF